jgi:hypothetical protein
LYSQQITERDAYGHTSNGQTIVAVSTAFGTTDVGVEVVGRVGRLDSSTDLERLQPASVLMAWKLRLCWGEHRSSLQVEQPCSWYFPRPISSSAIVRP